MGLVYRRNPTTELFGGDIQIADAALRYRTAEFPDVQRATASRSAAPNTRSARPRPSSRTASSEATVSLAKL